ncbi:MAG: leucine-rich repeat domain-containing protein [Pirellulales bacterium]
MTALCLGIGGWSQSALRQRRAVARLHAIGIRVDYGPEHGKNYPLSDWIASWIGIDFVSAATTLSGHDTFDRRHREEFFSALAELPHVKHIWFYEDFGMTDDDLQEFSEVRGLESFLIAGSRVSVAGLVHLEQLKKLQELSVVHCRVTPEFAQAIGRLRTLTKLHIGGAALSNEVLRGIGTLSQLEVLSLSDAVQITDAGLPHLAAMPRLRHVAIAEAQISDAGLQSFAGLEELQSLYIREADVSDRGLECLISLWKLESVCLRSGTDLTRFQGFRAARPNCKLGDGRWSCCLR